MNTRWKNSFHSGQCMPTRPFLIIVSSGAHKHSLPVKLDHAKNKNCTSGVNTKAEKTTNCMALQQKKIEYTKKTMMIILF
jgi:hypothetical protein